MLHLGHIRESALVLVAVQEAVLVLQGHHVRHPELG